jgi:hypothetical protein
MIFTRATDGPYAALAEDIAADRDEPVVSDINRVHQADSVLIVDAPGSIKPSDLRAIQTRFMEAEPYTLDAGLITGRTPEEARALYFDRAQSTATAAEPADTQHCIAVPDANESIGTNDDTAALLTGDSVRRAQFRGLADGGLDSLSAVLHGSHMFSRLADGLLSGFPAAPADYAFDGQQPPFVDQDAGSQRVEEQAILAETLEIPQVFLDGCSALLQNMNDGKDRPVHTALSLLAGAESMIGTYRITECVEHHGPLHHNLLRAGYSAGERAYILNRSAVTAGVEPYPYVVAGLPSHEPSPATVRDQTYTTTLERADDRCFVTVSDVDTPIIDVRVPADVFAPDAETFAVRCVDGPKHPLSYTAFREGEDVRVVINAWGLIVADQFEFEVAPSRTIDESRSRLAALAPEDTSDTTVARMTTLTESVPDAEQVLWAELPERATRQSMKECRSALRRVNEKAATERFAVQDYRETLDALAEASEHLERARGNLVETVCERESDSIQDLYLSRTDTAQPETLDSDCPYCHGTVYLRVREDRFGPAARALGICANCAYVFDAPHDHTGDVTFPRIWGSFHDVSADTQTFTVEFENPLDRLTTASCRLSVEQLSDEEVIGRPTREVVLEPGETITVEYTLDVTGIREHLRSTWSQSAAVSIEPDYSTFGPRFADVGPDNVEAALEELAADGHDALGIEPVTVAVDGQEVTVDPSLYDVERGEPDRSYSLAELSGNFVVEAHVVLDTLHTYSGTRTLHPDMG